VAKEGSSFWRWIYRAALLALLVLILVALWGSTPEDRILHDDAAEEDGVFIEIPVEGVITDSDAYGTNPVTWVEKCLERAGRERRLSGILLRVNSPGGGIRASDVILRAVREFKEYHEVPVVVFMKDVAASGGYYVSMASDWIVAHEDTITGSIGVIWPTMNWEVLTKEKLGVKFSSVRSAPMKDILSPDRQMTDEERALIQGMVDDAFAKFVGLVVEGRKGKGSTPVTEESVRALQSRIVSGRLALEAGLVDQLGFREDAVAKLKELAGIERADVAEYAKPVPLLEQLFLGEKRVDPLEQRLARLAYLYAEGPPLMALWER
jgi:protease-4